MNNNKSDLEHTSKIEDHFTGFFADMAAARWMYSLKGIKNPRYLPVQDIEGLKKIILYKANLTASLFLRESNR